ncbi:Wzz/FepE/Etk N-terminal domain-containing protein [Ekhidna sp. MALMAid0563]|uniref:Wzz/FepE/Etk N-terminal domain-containing protein n=1 Tax=Ekhidna sp. MALMAid0563 TaxID=3143937 RepID=UPI0032DFCEEF
MTQNEEPETIDFGEILGKIKNGKRKIIVSFIISCFLGIIVAFGTKKQFESVSRVLPSSSSSGVGGKLGALGGLAGLAGLNIDLSGGNSIPIEIYPEVINSTTFKRELADSKIYFSTIGDSLTISQYILHEYKPSLMEYLALYTIDIHKTVKAMLGSNNDQSNPDPKVLSREDKEIMKFLKDRIILDVSKKSGIISVNTQFPDPAAAANINQLTLDKLAKVINTYKNQQTYETYKITLAAYAKAKENLESANRELANFLDANRQIATASGKIQEEVLRDNKQIAMEVFSSLAVQLEQSRIQLDQTAAIFQIIEEPLINNAVAKPNKKLILAVFMMLGIMIAILIILKEELIKIIF